MDIRHRHKKIQNYLSSEEVMRWYIRHIFGIQISTFMWIFNTLLVTTIHHLQWMRESFQAKSGVIKPIEPYLHDIHLLEKLWLHEFSVQIHTTWSCSFKVISCRFSLFFFSHQWICVHSFHRDYRIQGTVSMLQHMVKTYGWLPFCLYLFYLFILNYVIHIISWNPFNLRGYK